MKTNTLKPFIFIIFFQLVTFRLMPAIDLNFKYYFVEDGLSSNTIYTIIQDSYGFIWIGTEDGLNRFNGYEFDIYRNIPRDTSSIHNNHIYALHEDDNRKIWIGTEKGISIYDLNTKKFSRFSLKTSNGISIDDKVQNIISDKDGQIWISSNRQGFFIYNKQNHSLKNISLEKFAKDDTEDAYLTCIYKDKTNNIWASINHTKNQIYLYNKKTEDFEPAFPAEDINEIKKLTSYAIIEDTFGTLWFGTWNNGLCAVDKKSGIKHTYLNSGNDKILHIHSITEYEPGKLLIGSNDGLTTFLISSIIPNRLESHIREPHLSNRFVYPVFQDKEGGLWIGTYYGGINYSSPNRNYFSSYTFDEHKNSINGVVVSAFCEDEKGNIWIGTDDGGLNHFNITTEQFTTYLPEKNKNSLSFHNLHALCMDNDNKLWIGTYTGGLNQMDIQTKYFKHYFSVSSDSSTIDSNSIYALFKDSEGNIWAGSMKGINRYKRETDNFAREKNVGNMIIDIIELNQTIWFATIGSGIFTYNLKTKEWKNYLFDPNNFSSIISNDINCFCIDESNQLWVGTSSGLCQYNDENDSFELIDMKLESNSICKIFSENDNLWITTTKGLINYSPKNKQYRVFNKEDGLLSDQFMLNSGIQTSTGKIFVGTAIGFNTFYPKQITSNRYIPPVKITDFQIFNNSVDLNHYTHYDKNKKPYIKIRYNENSFNIQYTALSYFAPEKNEYAYMLEGFDKQWNNVGKARKAYYTNIPPGEYTFKTKASNNNGLWNDNGQEIKIIITSPIWWNNWSIALYILVAIAIITLLIIYFNKRKEKENSEKIERIKRDQEKEIYNSKISFFTTIAHEIRTPVSLIIGPLEETIKSMDSFSPKIIGNLKMIERNAHRLLDLINQILDFQKTEKNTIKLSLSTRNVNELISNIYTRFKPSIEQKNIDFIFTTNTNDFETNIDPELLTKIISNLLTNASKFTKDFIELSLQVHEQNNYFEISVADNGAGIAKEEQENIFKPFYQIPGVYRPGTGLGLHTVKSIVDLWNGKIIINSDREKGSMFIIQLPLINNVETDKTEPSNTETDLSKTLSINDIIDINEIENKLKNNDKKTILVVEDNKDMQEFIVNSLSNKYNILLADDGIRGLRILERQKVSVIISDIMMPHMDGIEFCNKVKNNFLLDHIPFIMLTSKTSLDSKIEALEIGADAYIEKPFSITYLSAQIKNLYESRKNLRKKYARNPLYTVENSPQNRADEIFLSKTMKIIEKNISNFDFTVDQLAKEMGISSSGFFAKIKSLTDTTPNKLLLLIRLKKAAELLLENKHRISEICFMVGFNNPSYFSKCFQKQYNVLPKDYTGEPGADDTKLKSPQDS